MQVYLAVQDDERNTVIVRKREFSKWWNGQLTTEESLVSQAGQWALPGGRLAPDESPVLAAIREFGEETAVDLSGLVDSAMLHECDGYVLVTIRPAPVLEIVNRINLHVAPNPAYPMVPSCIRIRNWEIQLARLVGVRELERYLGVPQGVSEKVRQAKHGARLYSQLIDWYAEMARLLLQDGRQG